MRQLPEISQTGFWRGLITNKSITIKAKILLQSRLKLEHWSEIACRQLALGGHMISSLLKYLHAGITLENRYIQNFYCLGENGNIAAGHVTRIIFCIYKISFKSKFLHSNDEKKVKGQFDTACQKFSGMNNLVWHKFVIQHGGQKPNALSNAKRHGPIAETVT